MTAQRSPGSDFTLAVHGGAGTILRSKMTPEREAAYHAGLRRALEAGRVVLADGGSALDAVTAAVMALEDEPLFNAGRGAVYTSAGQAGDGRGHHGRRDRAAGAVAGICGPRNPILAARAVMEHSGHVFLIGESALEFCRRQGSGLRGAVLFLHRATLERAAGDARHAPRAATEDHDESRKHGTVGAVARDRHGNLAAATSTGGMTAKAPGRVGDSPVIGAGTWADDETCAVSATGHGEIFIRYAAAHEIASRMRYAGQSLDEAARAVVIDMLAPVGGSGGIIAVDRAGQVSLPFNCSGMYRGVVRDDGRLLTAIYDEPLIDFQSA